MCCPSERDTGILHNIRRIFTGRPKKCRPGDKVYTYSMSQLKCLEQELCRLEDEGRCLEGAVSDAFCCDCAVDCEYLRGALGGVADRLECLQRDLEGARGCYDPCRDLCETDLICRLSGRACCLDTLVSDLCLQLDCLECGSGCYRGPCCDRRFADCGRCCPYLLSDPCGTCTFNPCGPVRCNPCEPVCGPCEPLICGPCGPIGCKNPCEPCNRGPCGHLGCSPCGFSGYDPCESVGCNPREPRNRGPCGPIGCSPCGSLDCDPYEPVGCNPCEPRNCGPCGPRAYNPYGPYVCNQWVPS